MSTKAANDSAISNPPFRASVHARDPRGAAISRVSDWLHLFIPLYEYRTEGCDGTLDRGILDQFHEDQIGLLNCFEIAHPRGREVDGK